MVIKKENGNMKKNNVLRAVLYRKQNVKDENSSSAYCRFNDMVIGGISSVSKDLEDNSDDIYNIKEDIIGKMKTEEGRKILLLHKP